MEGGHVMSEIALGNVNSLLILAHCSRRLLAILRVRLLPSFLLPFAAPPPQQSLTCARSLFRSRGAQLNGDELLALFAQGKKAAKVRKKGRSHYTQR